MNKNKYRGWIPVLSGYISFRNAFGQTIPARCGLPEVSGDLSDQLGLKVEQQRELRDDIVPSLSWRRFRNRVPAITGMFHFSMQAAWADHSESEIHGFIYARPITPELSIDATLPPFTGVVSETNGWITSFQLDRKGIVTLDWGNCDADSILEIIDSEFFNVSAQEAQDRLTFQTYLFLKDFIHSHKFHNGDDDSILVPYRIETDDDVSWYDKTARNLHASIVTAMRGRRFDVLNAMGQISYLDAFLQLRSGANPEFSFFNENSLKALLAGCEAKLERGKLVEAESIGMGSILLTLLFSFVAVLVAMLQLLQIPCIQVFTKNSECTSNFNVSPYAILTADVVLSNWAWSIAGVYASVLIVLFLFFRGVMHDLVSQRIGHRRLDWIVLRPIFGNLLGDYGRLMASFWVVIFASFIFLVLWKIIEFSLHL